MTYRWSIYAFALLVTVDILPSLTRLRGRAVLSLKGLIAVDTQLYLVARDIQLCHIVLDMLRSADRS